MFLSKILPLADPYDSFWRSIYSSSPLVPLEIGLSRHLKKENSKNAKYRSSMPAEETIRKRETKGIQNPEISLPRKKEEGDFHRIVDHAKEMGTH